MPGRNGENLDTAMPLNEQLAAVVETMVTSLPNAAQPVDRYSRQIGTVVSMPFDYRNSNDGYVEFGRDFDTRRIALPQVEVVYAEHKRPRRNEVLINRFAERGGLEARVWVQQSGEDIRKKYESAPWGHGLYEGGAHFSRIMENPEAEKLFAALLDPIVQAYFIEDFTVPYSQEQEMLDEAAQRQSAARASLQHDLDEIADSQRRAMIDTDRIILG